MMNSSGLHKTAQQWIEDGISYYKKHRFKEALWAFEHAIQIDPTSVKALHGRGIIFARMGQYQKAVESYEQASALAPNVAQIYADMAEALYKLKEYQRSGSCYRKAGQIQWKYESVYRKKIRMLFCNAIYLRSHGKHDEAYQVFRCILLLDPDNIQAVYYVSGEGNIPIHNEYSYEYFSEPSQPSKNQIEQERVWNNTGQSVFLTVHPFNCRCHECYEF